jgi:arylformamidase
MPMNDTRIIDITPCMHDGLAVFPGDQPFRLQEAMSFSKGNHLKLSSMLTSLHIGAHADAPNHYHPKGDGIDARALDIYMGQAQVIEVKKKPGERIVPSDLTGDILAPRVLFKTDSFPNPDYWNSDFCSLSPELIEYLHQKKVVLVGIDTPSVDPETSKKLESHQALFRTHMAVLEGLDLRQVQAGVFKLVALPLKIKDADAGPVRAILIDGPWPE